MLSFEDDMKKSIILVFFILALLPGRSLGEEAINYEITINGKTHDVSLGREYQTTLKSGETVKFRIEKKAIMTYSDASTRLIWTCLSHLSLSRFA